MRETEDLLGYRAKFHSNGREWRVLISDPNGADLLVGGECRKSCEVSGVFSDRTSAKLAAFAFIRANLRRN